MPSVGAADESSLGARHVATADAAGVDEATSPSASVASATKCRAWRRAIPAILSLCLFVASCLFLLHPSPETFWSHTSQCHSVE